MFKSQEIKIRNKARKAIINYMKKHGDEVDSTYNVNGACFFNSFLVEEADAWLGQNAEKIINSDKVSEELSKILKEYVKANNEIIRQEMRESYIYDASI